MKSMTKGALGALLLGSVAFVAASPASAGGVSVGVGIGLPGVTVAVPGVNVDVDGCDDYYEPPWGYPDDYCNYDLWDEPVYYNGTWYSGPFYVDYDEDDVPMYWINGEWVYDEWNGPRPRVWSLGSPGFVLWAGRSHFGRHVWVFGGHNWVFRHGSHPHFGGGHGGPGGPGGGGGAYGGGEEPPD